VNVHAGRCPTNFTCVTWPKRRLHLRTQPRPPSSPALKNAASDRQLAGHADGVTSSPNSLAGTTSKPRPEHRDLRRIRPVSLDAGRRAIGRFYVRALTIDRPRSVTAGVLRPGSAASSSRVSRPVAAGVDSAGSLRGRLPGRQAGRLGMGPAGMPGQDPAEVAGAAGHGAVADLAARAPDRGNGHGKRREPRLLIRSGDAGSVAVTVPCAARTPRGTDEGSWPARAG
jgi:hypothetical protein